MSDIVKNPKARRDYHILDTYEAGIVLRGTEVKSLRAGKGQIGEAYARVENGEVWLYNAHIDEYSHGNMLNHQPKSKRKLLLHKPEIRKLFDQVTIKGNALFPMSMYWKTGKVKVKLGVGKGKAQHDKRQDLKEKNADLEMRRAIAASLKGR